MPRLCFIALLVSLALSSAVSAAKEPAPAAEPIVRVLLRDDAPGVVISCDGCVKIWRRGTGLQGSSFGPGVNLEAEAVALSDRGSSAGHCSVAGWGIRLTLQSNLTLGAFPEELVVQPQDPGQLLSVDGCAYRGELVLSVGAPGMVTVTNILRIEDYLCGVVPCEMGGTGVADNALQAQSIAARSYALHSLAQRAGGSFDFLPGQEDQVYGGAAVEREDATRAVLASRGVVAAYDGVPIRANYCSTCGGETESAERIWPGQGAPYLRAVHDESHSGRALCASSKYFRWTEEWTCEDLQRTIATYLPQETPEASGRDLGRLRDLRIIKRSSSGRVEVLEIRMDGGKFRVQGDRIRRVLRRADGGLLRSTRIDKIRVSHKDGCKVSVEGSGWGHGVGMCQVGAMELGAAGASAAQILRHYYRGIRLERWW